MTALRESLGKSGWAVRLAAGLAAFILFAVPALVLVATSWTEQRFALFPPKGFTLEWFGEVLTSKKWLQPFGRSATVAAIGTALAVILGVAAAIGVSRLRSSRAARAWRTVMILPLAVPPIALGVGLYNMGRWLNLSDGRMALLILGQMISALPFVFVLVAGAITRLDPNLHKAAQTLGANSWLIIRKVELPLLGPTILAAAVFAFVVIFDEVVLAVFLLPPGVETLPVTMLRASQETMTPALTAASTVVSLLAVLLLGGSQMVGRGKKGGADAP
ncbi:MAG: ABC transporter permease [Bifidobacteriaceae bacterium]|jgi:putative spermidine/putrescine transport system permease protein|nr:ABC transporter permease [Bifidobacteriaceae bacterium]